MTNIVTTKFSVFNAKQISNVIQNKTSNVFVFIARPYPWTNESIPDTVKDTSESDFKIWDGIISLRKILPQNSCLVIPRIDWKIGTYFAEFDDKDPDLKNKNFYVMNRDFGVYICIDNNNGFYSTVEPSGESLEPFILSDNYMWKYLYTISPTAQLKFLTSNWIPVLSNPDVVDSAIDGKIDKIRVITSGSGYYSSNTNIIISGNGSNLSAIPKIVNGKVDSIIVTNGGTDYRYATANVVGSGSGATANVVIPPYGGHGYEPSTELFARYLMINSRLIKDALNSDFSTNVTYRTIGIIDNVKDFTNSYFNNTTANANYVISVTADVGASFPKNQYFSGNISTANAYIIDSSTDGTGNTNIRYIQTMDLNNNFKKFVVGERVTTSATGASGVIKNIYLPDIKKYTGDIIYVDNRTAITRSVDQVENIHIVLEF
jgi:hypothetical protein